MLARSNVLRVVLVKLRMPEVQNVSRVKQVRSVMSKVNYANLVPKESTVKAKKRTMTPRIRIQLSV